MTATVKLVSGKQSVAYRNYRRARDRALSRLAQAYPNDYKELLEQEKASDKLQGKNWIGADTLIAVSTMDFRPNTTTTPTNAAGNYSKNEGYNAREEGE